MINKEENICCLVEVMEYCNISIRSTLPVFPKGFKIHISQKGWHRNLMSAIFISHQPNWKNFVNILFLRQFLDVSQNDWREISLRQTFWVYVRQSWCAGIFWGRLPYLKEVPPKGFANCYKIIAPPENRSASVLVPGTSNTNSTESMHKYIIQTWLSWSSELFK